MFYIVLLITLPGTNNMAIKQLAEDPRALEEIKQLQSEAIGGRLELTPGPSL